MKKIFAAILILCILLCTACSSISGYAKYSLSFYDYFDTEITITAYCCKNIKDFSDIFNTAEKLFEHYHQLADIYNEYDGMVNAASLNKNAGQGYLECDPDLVELLEYSIYIYSLTADSAVESTTNIAMGSVLSLWHAAREDGNYIPSDTEINKAAQHTDITDILIDGNKVLLQDPDMSIDLGAVAKGYATEKVAQALESAGCSYILINAGGNLRSIGTKPDGSSWIAGITNPPSLDNGKTYADMVELNDKALATSGSYERYYVYNGQTYHHIISSQSGYPENYYLSVSVLSADAGLSDGLSTALFSAQLQNGQKFIEETAGVEALWILTDGTIVKSSGWESYTK